MFILPSHQIVFSVVWSFTIYLSFGERPVKTPVFTATAPEFVKIPFSKPSFSGDISSWKSCS